MVDGPSSSRPAALLIVVAAPTEAAAVRRGAGLDGPARGAPHWQPIPLAPGVDLLLTGVGKANAAGAVAAALAMGRHGAVVNIGIAGALPHGSGAASIGTVVFAESSVFADDGVQTEKQFQSLAAMGWGIAPDATDSLAPSPLLASALRPLARVHGAVATVSTCSGTDASAAEVVRRTLHRLGDRGQQHRRTLHRLGDRARQRWDIPAAMNRLATLAGDVIDVIDAMPARTPGA